MEIILENAFVKKAITMITKIAFAWNAHNFGKIINSTLFFAVIHAFIIKAKIRLFALTALKIMKLIIIIVI